MIIQTNTWICGICGKTESTVEEVSAHSDVVTNEPRKGWGYVYSHNPEINDRLACPECFEREDEG